MLGSHRRTVPFPPLSLRLTAVRALGRLREKLVLKTP